MGSLVWVALIWINPLLLEIRKLSLPASKTVSVYSKETKTPDSVNILKGSHCNTGWGWEGEMFIFVEKKKNTLI